VDQTPSERLELPIVGSAGAIGSPFVPLSKEMDPEEAEQNREQEELKPAIARWRERLRARAVKIAANEAPRKQERLERPRTVREAAEELGLSVHTVRAWIASRRLGHLRLGRAIRIPAAEIRRVLEESAVPAVKED
jgi:excisionase family DNA binding protein